MGESVTTFNTSNKVRSTRGEKVRRKFHRNMEFFLTEGGSCLYDDERIGDVEVPLRYKNLLRPWVPNEIPQLDTYFYVNERIYHIAPSSYMVWFYSRWME
jgi:hypothetical protein